MKRCASFYKAAEKAADGSVIAVGAERKRVDRLRRRRPELNIVWPGSEPSIGVDMSKSTLAFRRLGS